MTYEHALGEPHREGLRARELRLPRCTSCGRFHWYPMRLCPHCRSPKIVWTAVDPSGSIYTVTTVHHAFGDLEQTVPYTVAIVELPAASGVRILAEIEPATPDACIGDAVSAVFRTESDEPRLLYRLLHGASDAQ